MGYTRRRSRHMNHPPRVTTRPPLRPRLSNDLRARNGARGDFGRELRRGRVQVVCFRAALGRGGLVVVGEVEFERGREGRRGGGRVQGYSRGVLGEEGEVEFGGGGFGVGGGVRGGLQVEVEVEVEFGEKRVGLWGA